MSVRRIVYLSTAFVALTQADLDELLEIARANNARRGLTGLLLYHDGSFMQVLEGPADAVEATLQKIRSDIRHTSILILSDEIKPEPDFGGWSMGFVPASDYSRTMEDGFVRIAQLATEIGTLSGARDRTTTAIIESFISSFRELACI